MVLPPPGLWVEEWLSQARFDRYLSECAGDPRLALRTYEWNAELGQAVMRDAGHFEVALRNAFDRAVSERWHGSTHWLMDTQSPVRKPLWRVVRGRSQDINVPNRSSLAEAAKRSGARAASSDQLVASLTLGFWQHMCDTAHEQAVWIPYVYHAWPRGTSRSHVYGAIDLIRVARNEAAHNEPLFTLTGRRGVPNVYATIVSLLRMLNPTVATLVQQTSRVQALLARRPR